MPNTICNSCGAIFKTLMGQPGPTKCRDCTEKDYGVTDLRAQLAAANERAEQAERELEELRELARDYDDRHGNATAQKGGEA